MMLQVQYGNRERSSVVETLFHHRCRGGEARMNEGGGFGKARFDLGTVLQSQLSHRRITGQE